MGAVGSKQTEGKPVVKRMDISKLSDAQQRAMNLIYERIEIARSRPIEEWALYRIFDTTDYETAINKRITAYQDREKAKEMVDNAVANWKNWYNDTYEKDKQGIIDISLSSNVLRALEKRGFIEVIQEGLRARDIVKIIEK